MKMLTPTFRINNGKYKRLYVIARTGSIIELGTFECRSWGVDASGFAYMRVDESITRFGEHGIIAPNNIAGQGKFYSSSIGFKYYKRGNEFSYIDHNGKRHLLGHYECDEWYEGIHGLYMKKGNLFTLVIVKKEL